MQPASAERKLATPEIRLSNPGSALAMAKGFRGYKPEEEKAVRKVEVVEDKTLGQMKAAWGLVSYDGSGFGQCYEDALAAVKLLNYSTSDVENFSLALAVAQFQDEERFGGKAGLFLSALINNGKDTDYIIHTVHLTLPLYRIGYKNTKNIIVNGDAGIIIGSSMEGGSITVNGNAGNRVGNSMKGGTITVKGDAGAEVGCSMNGGIVTVEGNAGEAVGNYMKSGEIRIGGEIESISKLMRHGKIYHKGKLLVDK